MKKFIFAVDKERVVNHISPVESLSYQFPHYALTTKEL